MNLIRQLVCFVVVLAMMPGIPQLLENLDHLVHQSPTQGPSDHELDEARHASLEAERGCSTMTHHCGCHISVPAVLPDEPTVEASSYAVLLVAEPPAFEDRLISRANAPPVPPPIA